MNEIVPVPLEMAAKYIPAVPTFSVTKVFPGSRRSAKVAAVLLGVPSLKRTSLVELLNTMTVSPHVLIFRLAETPEKLMSAGCAVMMHGVMPS